MFNSSETNELPPFDLFNHTIPIRFALWAKKISNIAFDCLILSCLPIPVNTFLSYLIFYIPCIPPTPNKYKASAPLMQTPSALYFLLFIRYQSSDSGSPASGYRYGSGSTAAPLISNWKCRWFPVESPVVPLKPIC